MALDFIFELVVKPFAELVVQPIAELVLHVAGYLTARVIVPVLTFGVVRVEPVFTRKFVRPGRGAIQRMANGNYCMDAEVGAWVGILIWILVGVGIYFGHFR